MDLHHTSGRPDWATVPSAERTNWQRMAARTGGAITPGNIITAVGFILVLIGLVGILRHAYWWGFALIVLGRLCDILDGLAAEATGTKSPLGEALDVACDKAGSILSFGALLLAHVISWPVAALLLLPNLSIIAFTRLAARRHTKLHPARSGKLAMAATWAALICFLLATALRLSSHSWLEITGDVFTALAFVLGAWASAVYWRDISR